MPLSLNCDSVVSMSPNARLEIVELIGKPIPMPCNTVYAWFDDCLIWPPVSSKESQGEKQIFDCTVLCSCQFVLQRMQCSSKKTWRPNQVNILNIKCSKVCCLLHSPMPHILYQSNTWFIQVRWSWRTIKHPVHEFRECPCGFAALLRTMYVAVMLPCTMWVLILQRHRPQIAYQGVVDPYDDTNALVMSSESNSSPISLASAAEAAFSHRGSHREFLHGKNFFSKPVHSESRF